MSEKPIRLQFHMRRIAGFTGNQLKMIAFLFMLCDHIGFVLIENGVLYGGNPVYWTMALQTAAGQRWYLAARILRFIGRLSFPIFAFLIMEGFTHTSNAKAYVLRLTLFALISEVPFDLAVNNTILETGYQNVMFTLALGAMSLWSMGKLHKMHLIFRIMTAGIFCCIAWLIRSDYGAVGVALISALYLIREDRNAITLVGGAISAAESIEYGCVSALAFLLIRFYNGKRGDFPLKYFFYLAYPGHLLLFRALVYFANR